MKPTLKGPGTKRLKLQYYGPLSIIAFKFNLRRYNVVSSTDPNYVIKDIDDPSYLKTPVVTISVLDDDLPGRGLHSFPFSLNLS